MNHPKVQHPSELMDNETFSDRLAKKLGAVLGNMKFFYFCVLLDVAELPSVLQHLDAIVLISYVAQTVIQLLALPVLQVYQNIITVTSGAKADADHQALTHIAHQVDKIVNQTYRPKDFLSEALDKRAETG